CGLDRTEAALRPDMHRQARREIHSAPPPPAPQQRDPVREPSAACPRLPDSVHKLIPAGVPGETLPPQNFHLPTTRFCVMMRSFYEIKRHLRAEEWRKTGLSGPVRIGTDARFLGVSATCASNADSRPPVGVPMTESLSA